MPNIIHQILIVFCRFYTANTYTHQNPLNPNKISILNLHLPYLCIAGITLNIRPIHPHCFTKAATT